MKRISLISDTHGKLDPRAVELMADSDEIWHAGDLGSMEVLEGMEKVALTRAVYGNIDDGAMRRALPLDLRFECEGVKVWMTHIAGRPGKYPARIRQSLEADPVNVFVCGHSHICLVQYVKQFNHIHLNPGALGWHGLHKVRTMLQFELENGRVENMRVIELGPRSRA